MANVSKLCFFRNEEENRFSVLMKLKLQMEADRFYCTFNGTRFNRYETEVCHVYFIQSLEYSESAEIAAIPLPGFTELPPCPVCLERLDSDTSAIHVTQCDHSIDCSCLSKGSYLSCQAIANACKVPTTSVSELTESDVPTECEEQFDEDEELDQLISGKICFKVYPFSSELQLSSVEKKVILSGSFNPLHDGHLKLLEVATSIFGDGYPCFELSAVNADKPPLTVAQIKDRVKKFEKVGKTVIISNQPYFYKKAELFPGSAFVIGADTVARLINVLEDHMS